MKNIITIFLLYFTFLILVGSIIHANLDTSVSIINDAPTINSVTTYSSYSDQNNNVEASNIFLFSSGDTETVYVQINMSDNNGFSDITDNGNVSLIFVLSDSTTETDFARFGTSYVTPNLETNTGINAIYQYSFNMSSDDIQREDPLFYQIKVNISDGSTSTIGRANYSFIKTCINQTVNLIINTTNLVNATNDTDTTLEILTDSSVNGTLIIKETAASPVTYTDFDVEPLDKYLDIEISENINDSLTNATIKLYYNDSEISSAEVIENTLRLYRWDGSNWNQLSNSGVDTTEKYIWGVVDQFSIFGAFGDSSITSGSENPSESNTGGGSGGRYIPSWICTDWSKCRKGVQTRTCTDKWNWGIDNDKPEEIRLCSTIISTIEDIIIENVEELIGSKDEKTALFDIDVELINSRITYRDNNELLTKITLINFGKEGSVDAYLDYTITDSENNIVYEESEVVPVEAQKEFLKVINVSRLTDGKYILLLSLKYEGQNEPAISEKEFVISRDKTLINGAIILFGYELENRSILSICGIGIIILSIINLIIYKIRKREAIKNHDKKSSNVNIKYGSKKK